MSSVLVIDDDRSVQHLVSKVLRDQTDKVHTASSAAEGFATLERESIDLVILDVVLPDNTGLELFERIRKLDPRLPVIFITVVDDSDTAIEAMRLGAFDYITKPLDVARLQQLVQQGLEIRRLMNVPVSLDNDEETSPKIDRLIGKSPQMLEVYKTIGRIASQNIPVLILGESGTGKELVARAIYQHGDRSKGPFIALNCAAIPEALLESELFGHEKGSFTGATSLRIGKFEQCKGGTFLLDEIGDMPLLLQPKILRLLQEYRFERVGGNQSITTDVRIVAATHRNLEEMAAENRFRTDLLFRLNGVVIRLPALRERKQDIPPLVDHFLKRYRRELKSEVRSLGPGTLERLVDYDWPGNIRELQSFLKLAIVRATGSVLIPEFLPPELQDRSRTSVFLPGASTSIGRDSLLSSEFLQERIQAGTENLYAETIEQLDREVIGVVLRHTKGNQSQSSKILGITRGNLRNKIRSLGLSIEQHVNLIEEDAGSESDDPSASPKARSEATVPD